MANILLIDDDADIRKFVTHLLESEGYDVAVAEGGESASALLKSHSYDLVITDIFMPEKGGYEIIREIRRENSETKIIAISGYYSKTAANIQEYTTMMSVDRYYDKPFDVEDLKVAIRELIESC